MMTFKTKWLAGAISVLALSGCFSNDDGPVLSQGDVFVLTSNNQLATFNRTSPTEIRTSVPISGITAGDTLLGMDFRPRDGQLYAIARTTGNGGRLYTINTSTGAATVVANLTAHPTDTSAPFTTIDPAATSFGVDFNPAADALRVISNTGQNLRIFVQTVAGLTPDRQAGFTFTDTALNRSDGSAATFADSGTAYTNSFDGTTSTRMFNLDVRNANLIEQTDPNGGVTRVVAPLFGSATTLNGTNGFDIDAKNNVGFALLNIGGSNVLHRITIPPVGATLPASTPAATAVGTVNVSGVVGLALAPATAPQVVALEGATAGAQRLLKFGVRTPNNASTTNVTGLPAGERLLSIDFRPSNSTVYGLSSTGRIYTLNTDTGSATLAVTLNVANAITNGLADGKRYQIDFNPQADALRIVSSNGSGTRGENYRIAGARLTAGADNAGVVAGDDVALTDGFSTVSIAYSNSFANPGPTVTQMFNIDGANNRLAQQGNPFATPPASPNGGVLTAVGTTGLGNGLTSYGGFDISGGDNGMRLLAGRAGATGTFSVFNVDLTAGTASAASVASGTNAIGSGANASTDLQDLTIRF